MRKHYHSSYKTVIIGCIIGALILSGVCVYRFHLYRNKERRWKDLLKIYQNDEKTDCLIFVKCKGRSRAQLELYKKHKMQGEYQWRLVLSCGAHTGKNGLDKKEEGDGKTPTGTFWITKAFGIKNDPGTALSYTKVNEYHYWSEEEETYNQLIDVRKLGKKKIKGEHLIAYAPAYHYALVIGYNTEGIYKKGSAIFLHGKTDRTYTAGCVAISEANMKRVLINVTKNAKICIYK